MSGVEVRDPFEDIFDDDFEDDFEDETDGEVEGGGTESAVLDGTSPSGAGSKAAHLGDSEVDDEGAGTEPGGGGPVETEPGQQQAGGFSPEEDARINAEAQKRVDALVAKQYAGKVNPYNGKPIASEADLNEYIAAYNADLQRQQLQDMGIDQNKLNEIVRGLPEVQQAQQMIAQQQQAQATAMMQSEFDALKKEYPDCGFADVASMLADPEGKKVLEFWRDSPGLKISDAYLIQNKEKIMSQKAAAAKQGALNQMNGKKHLSQTKGNNGNGELSADILREYRKYFPKSTDAEILEMYRKNHEGSE